MARRSKQRPTISESEWAVMKVVWEDGPMATGEIYERLADDREWAYSTVKTLVRRLVEKGWLTYRKVGNSFLYRPAVPRARAVRAAVSEFSSRVLDGLLSPFVAYYAEENGLSAEEVARLEEILAHERKRGGR
jgi:BlaI family penicillinase repressor